VRADLRTGSVVGAGSFGPPHVADDGGLPGSAVTVAAGTDADADADSGQPVSLLEVTVDDATGEQLADAIGVLLDAGAHDAWLNPVVMKKGRPGFVVQVLCDPSQVARLRGILRESTGSLGVRMVVGERWPATRSIESVIVDGQLIRVKVSASRVKAEHDDVALAARRTGKPLRDIAVRAEMQWRTEQGVEGGRAKGGLHEYGSPAGGGPAPKGAV
jgi:uncharacterized protein (DUF111 family)